MLDLVASMPHYLDHLAPVWHALPEAERGCFYVTERTLLQRATDHGVTASLGWPRSGSAVLVAGYIDLVRTRRAGVRLAVAQHGAGQSYGTDHPSYPGGLYHDDVEMFLVPNEHAGERWRRRYPSARVAVVGSPRLDELPPADRRTGLLPVVALSFHNDLFIDGTPEMRSAQQHYRHVLAQLRLGPWHLLGHGHPRAWPRLRPWYLRSGVELVPEFDEVLRRADLYVCDNSSTLFEFASTGRPVVVLNAPWYRRTVEHGLRYWSAAGVGYQCNDPAELVSIVDLALTIDRTDEREAALASVYAVRRGAAAAAAQALVEWLA